MKIWDINPYGSGGGGSGGSDKYSNSTPVPEKIGGISAGSTFADKTMKEMWDMLLYVYLAPAFSSFAVSGVSTTLEVGNSVPANKTFTWGITNAGNISPNTISITDVTGGQTLGNNLANTGSFTHNGSAVTKTTATSHTWRISTNQLEGGAVTRNFAVNWQWRLYYGESGSGTLDETGIKGLRVSNLSSSVGGNYNFSAGGYKYICCSSNFSITSMKDQATGFNVPFEAPYTVSVTNSFGVTQSYKVYRTSNVLGGAVTIIVA